jgi:hypothetical protein
MKVDLRNLLVALLLGALGTALLSAWDSARQRRADEEWALRLARQVGEQAQAFHLSARLDGANAPLAWVVKNLAQGVDPRLIRVTTLRTRSTHQEARGSFVEHRRVLESSGDGIRVQVSPPRTLLLGSRNKLQQDLTSIFVFLFFSGAFHLLLRRRRTSVTPTFSSESRASLPPVTDHEPGLAIPVAAAADIEGLARSRFLLREVGLRFKDTFEQARRIAAAATRSHRKVDSLRTGLHQSLNRLHFSARKIEVALARVTELERSSGAGLGPEKARVLAPVQEALRETAREVREVQRAVEPWCNDADEAYHAFAELGVAAGAMDEQLPRARDLLVEQARILQRLGKAA